MGKWIAACICALIALTTSDVFGASTSAATRVTSLAEPTPITGAWKFRPADDPAFASPRYDDSQWRAVTVPGMFAEHGAGEYVGFAWYRTVVELSEEVAADGIGLELGIIDDCDETFVNGVKVGWTGGLPPTYHSALSFSRIYYVPSAVLRPGANVIAVRVYNARDAGGFVQGPLRIGEARAMGFVRLGREFLQRETLLISTAFLIVFAVYFLYLSARGIEPRPYFYLGAGLVALSTLGLWNHRSVLYLIYNDNLFWFKLTSVTMILGGHLLAGFFAEFYRLPHKRGFGRYYYPYIFWVAAAFMVIFPFVGDELQANAVYKLWMATFIPTVLGLLYVFFTRRKVRQGESRYFGAAAILIALGFVNDWMVYFEVYSFIYVSAYQGVIAMTPVILSLVNGFVRNYKDLEATTAEEKSLRAELEVLNKSLESKVKARTEALKQRSGELEKVNKKLREMDVMKTNYLSIVAHDLRTPMTSIQAYAELLGDADRALDAEERAKFADIIVRETDRLTRLVTDLLDIDKMEAGKMEWNMVRCNLRDIGEHVGYVFEGIGKDKEIALVKDVACAEAFVVADADRISQVLSNLLSNAMKFTPPQGQVTLHIAQENGHVVTTVRDTGPGIPREMAEVIFDRFAMVNNPDISRHRGSGLGLTIAREIVKNHGGNIWVESEEGAGSAFRFTLPSAA